MPQTEPTKPAKDMTAPGRTIRTVCVYCGSGEGRNPAYANAADTFGKDLADNGVGLVYGGGSLGLMGRVARGVLHHGGHVTGIIPSFLAERERMLRDVNELIETRDMHERKRLMFERSDAFVALPGGVGTLEETVEMLTWSQLGQHDKPILLANIERFWDPLIDLLDHMLADTFIRPGLMVRYLVVNEVADILPALTAAAQDGQAATRDADAPSISNL